MQGLVGRTSFGEDFPNALRHLQNDIHLLLVPVQQVLKLYGLRVEYAKDFQ